MRKRLNGQWILGLVLMLIILLTACGQNAEKKWQEQYDLGVRYLSEGNYEEAIIAFTAAIEIDPKRYEAYEYLINSYINMQEFSNARMCLLNGLDNTESQELLAQAKELGWYVPNPDDEVEWHDKTFEEMLRQGLGKPNGSIFVRELEQIESLTILGNTHIYINEESNHTWTSPQVGLHYYTVDGVDYYEQGQITSLQDLMWFPNLKTLTVDANQITDLAPLAGCPALEELSLNCNNIDDISPLAALTELKSLALRYNRIQDISSVSQMTKLTYLGVSANQIYDISSLKFLTNLENLNLWNNQITDISAIAPLTALTVLRISDNQISDISPLAGMTKLKYLSISNNQISDITPLSGLEKLETLHTSGNRIRNWSPITHLPEGVVTGMNQQN